MAADTQATDLPVYCASQREPPDRAGQARRETNVMATTTLDKTSATFTVRQLSPVIGAEILGVDLRDPIDDTLRQKFLDAWHQHLIILLRNQTLDEDAQ